MIAQAQTFGADPEYDKSLILEAQDPDRKDYVDSLYDDAQKLQKLEYTVGINDVLEISIIQPDELSKVVTVAPDGSISFPYIGRVHVTGLTLSTIQDFIQNELANGYLKYPVVLVTLQESRSRNYLVYGEVQRPGEYAIGENATVLKAISMAGGFTKFGSSSRVKILRPKQGEKGYDILKINIKDVMNGDADADVELTSGDIVIVSEGVF
ncbi:MAG: polysaccharide export protein [Candidatus Omnitrophica bacterium]|nr:polysaccharide export protein [Candidatus Omnitrophota bacterium]MCB9747011.1 polysaccharide export protein [Candidatus Omnitrophota bacterium]